MRFQVKASVGNANGIFDAAYDFGAGTGDEAEMTGTPEEIGQEVTRFLSGLTPEDCVTMCYGTPNVFIQLTITPEEQREADEGEQGMQVQSKCSRCRATVVLHVPEGFEEAGHIAVTCRDCADRQVQEEGGLVLDLPQFPGALFELGHIRVTAGVVAALGESQQQAVEFLTRHARGDWGESGQAGTIPVTEEEVRAGPICTEEPDKANQLALLTGTGRILSDYVTNNGTRLWCLTDRFPSGKVETCLLLPEEY